MPAAIIFAVAWFSHTWLYEFSGNILKALAVLWRASELWRLVRIGKEGVANSFSQPTTGSPVPSCRKNESMAATLNMPPTTVTQTQTRQLCGQKAIAFLAGGSRTSSPWASLGVCAPH